MTESTPAPQDPMDLTPISIVQQLGPWPSLSGRRLTASLYRYAGKRSLVCGELLELWDETHQVARVKLEIGHTNMYMLFTPESKYVPDPSGARAALENALVEGAKRAVFYGGLQGDVVFTLGDRDNPLGLTFENGRLDPGQPAQPIYGVAGFDDYEYDLAQHVWHVALKILKTKYTSGMPWADVVRVAGYGELDLDDARKALLRAELVEAIRGGEHVIYRIKDQGVDWLSGREDAMDVRRDLISVGVGNKREYILPPGNKYRAMSLVLKVMQLARTRLFVADAWLDDSVFQYLEAVDPVVDIRLLTAKRKPIFGALLKALQESRPNVDARQCEECHDRFLVIDDSIVWHLGASINGLGSKLARLSKVTDEEDRKRYLGIFDDLWERGTAVVAQQ
jgi:hypothetical protein